jgi:hypothetical protein
VKASLSGVPASHIPATLGADRLAGFGVDEQQLLEDEYTSLRESWDQWLRGANRQALAAACALAGVSPHDPRVDQARRRQEAAAEAGWTWLLAAMKARASRLLFNPDPRETEPPEIPEDTSLMPPGAVRAAVAVAGGYNDVEGSAGISGLGVPVDFSRPLTGVSSGPYVSDVLTSAGSQISGFEWHHGAPQHPFDPHERLDGYEFTSWNADGLTPGDDASWLGVGNLFPGDHGGCTCDVTVLWTAPADQSLAASGASNG